MLASVRRLRRFRAVSALGSTRPPGDLTLGDHFEPSCCFGRPGQECGYAQVRGLAQPLQLPPRGFDHHANDLHGEVKRVKTVDAEEESFWNESAELGFKLAFQGYLVHGEGSPEGATVRADAFAIRRAARVAVQRGAPVPVEEVAQWREQTRAFLLNHEARFDLEWRKFFYIDEFPENAARFDFTIDDCRPADQAAGSLPNGEAGSASS